ncbi:jg9562, partial [Pararge aegeria aegeria]
TQTNRPRPRRTLVAAISGRPRRTLVAAISGDLSLPIVFLAMLSGESSWEAVADFCETRGSKSASAAALTGGKKTVAVFGSLASLKRQRLAIGQDSEV